MKIIVFLLLSLGFWEAGALLFRLPNRSEKRMAKRLLPKKEGKTETFLQNTAKELEGRIKLSSEKRERLQGELSVVDSPDSPEEFEAKRILIGVLFALAALVVFILRKQLPAGGWIAAGIAAAGVYMVINPRLKLSREVEELRKKVEDEIPELVSFVLRSVRHNRDVTGMLREYYAEAGPELKRQLEITLADMNSGNQERALLRWEGRVGSAGLRDLTRGLISMLRGDDTALYWETLSYKLAEQKRQRLRAEAGQIPRKINRLSMLLLIAFMAIYLTVMLQQIIGSLGTLFA